MRPLGPRTLSESSDYAHHIGGSYYDVKIKPVFTLDLLSQFFRSDILCSGSFRFLHFVALCEDQNSLCFSCAMRQNDRASDLLVSVSSVNTQFDMDFDRFIKLGLRCCECQFDRFFCVIKRVFVN